MNMSARLARQDLICEDIMTKTECIWKEEKGLDTDGVYQTGCDNMFTIMEGNPKDNGFKYCPYCAGTIVEESAIFAYS